MATVKKTERKEVVVREYTLTLTEEEARVLFCVTQNTSGHDGPGGYRETLNRIGEALEGYSELFDYKRDVFDGHIQNP